MITRTQLVVVVLIVALFASNGLAYHQGFIDGRHSTIRIHP